MHTRRTRRNLDAFLSYAGEAKADVVQPLTTMLSDGALNIWVGYRELRIGDSLVGRISEGLRHSRYGVVVLSPSFFKKPWPKTELDAIFTLDQSDRCKLLPVWHCVTLEDVNEHSPLLASRVAAETSDGIDQVATRLFDEIAKTRQAGVKTHRKRMLAIQKSRESFGSDIIFSPKEVTDLLGVRMATLRTWHDRRWGATTGSWPNVSYGVHNLLIIAALHHWSINRLKLSDGIAGRLHYAIRAARVPFVAICITGDIPWVRTAEPDGLLEALTGAPPALIYNPEDLLVEIHDRGAVARGLVRRPKEQVVSLTRTKRDSSTDTLF